MPDTRVPQSIVHLEPKDINNENNSYNLTYKRLKDFLILFSSL